MWRPEPTINTAPRDTGRVISGNLPKEHETSALHPDADEPELTRLYSRFVAPLAVAPHVAGAAVDLTLVDLKADNSAAFDPAKPYADCTANVKERAPEGSVDMGTGYDCSDVKAHTAAKQISSNQRRWRDKLVSLDGTPRLCELYEGVVALFAAGHRRASL